MAINPTSIPLIMTSAGPVATPVSTLYSNLINYVSNQVPGYTVLPAGLIDDVSGTSVGALTAIDQARVDAINSVSPYGANAFLLAQLGAQFGVPQGVSANGNVYVQFTGPAGYVFQPGFLVGDGSNQYALQDGGVIQSNGMTPLLYAVATNSGTFPIPANTVTKLVTSIPSAYTVTVTNPSAGFPATSAESVQAYRSRVLQAGQVSSIGTPAYVKTLIEKVTGVQARLVSINAVSGGWQIVCGGGDAYSVANAILQGVGDIATLQGSQLAITGMTAANPVVITTNLNHGYIAGQTVTVAGATPNAYNLTYTISSVTATTITTTTNGSGFGAYVSGATLSPNPRNVSVSLFQNPNTYTIPFVIPPQQNVTVSVTWHTTMANFTGGTSVAQLAAPALQAYLNSIYVGQPINLLMMTEVFQNAVSSVILPQNITTLQFTVTVNGVSVSPTAGTSIIPSDPESFFNCASNGVTVTQS
jgi:hypothetical protein